MIRDQSQLAARVDHAVDAFQAARNPIEKASTRRDLEKLKNEAARQFRRTGGARRDQIRPARRHKEGIL
jgi:hypothetical protein